MSANCSHFPSDRLCLPLTFNLPSPHWQFVFTPLSLWHTHQSSFQIHTLSPSLSVVPTHIHQDVCIYVSLIGPCLFSRVFDKVLMA